jgi:hypothetical protein
MKYNFLKLYPVKNHGKAGKRQGFGEWAIKLEGIHFDVVLVVT